MVGIHMQICLYKYLFISESCLLGYLQVSCVPDVAHRLLTNDQTTSLQHYLLLQHQEHCPQGKSSSKPLFILILCHT